MKFHPDRDFSAIDFDAALARARSRVKAASSAMDRTIAQLADQANATVTYAKTTYVNPYYGSIPPADKVILEGLRALAALSEINSQGARRLLDEIAKAYIMAARDSAERIRRCMQLIDISVEFDL